MQAGGKYRFNLPPGHNAFIYLLSGKLKIGGDDELENNYAAILHNDGDYIEVEALETAEFMLGSGEPLNEPIAANGPFVMNTETEIMEAFKDYKMGKMGILIED